MTVSSNTLSVAATVGGPAAESAITISVTNRPTSTLYLANVETSNGIASISEAGTSATTALATIVFKTPSSLGAGIFTDTLKLYVCEDSQCQTQVENSPQTIAVTYTVAAAPPPPPGLAITSINPGSVVVGAKPFPLIVTGTGFTSTDVVQVGGGPQPTTMLSPTQLAVTIPSNYTDSVGSLSIQVKDTSANTTSNTLTLNVLPYPTIALAAIWPSQVPLGSPPPTLTLLGEGFGNSSQVNVNGSARLSTFLTTGELKVQLTAQDVASLGTLAISVGIPGDTSNSLPLVVTSTASDASTYQVNAAHTGVLAFQNSTLPAAASWSIQLGGTVSYPVIGGGRIFVTYGTYPSQESLVALDANTGAVVWGPVGVGAVSNVSYDNGVVFVSGNQILQTEDPTEVKAFSAGDGTLLWTTPSPFQEPLEGAPTVANGFVYVVGSGSSLIALNETTGQQVWTQNATNGGGGASSASATASGVYLDIDCEQFAANPQTGALIWREAESCDGGNSYIAPAANGLLYAPNVNPTGYLLNAATGANAGYFSAGAATIAVTSQYAFYLNNRLLSAVSVANGTTAWTFAGDGQLTGSVLVINGEVFVQSNSGNLYAINISTGQVDWTQALGQGPAFNSLLITGMNAGDGLLLVPVGSSLTAFTLSSAP